MKFLVRTFVSWLPLAFAITGVCLLVYATVQQNYRQSLNDPQIQMAEDGAAKFAAGGVPAELVQRGVPPVDIAKSLAPWIVVYDYNGIPLESSGVLAGEPPHLPAGVLLMDKYKNYDLFAFGEDRVTWQPSTDVRQAIVVVYVPSSRGFVVAGRNMREVENREGNLTTFVGLAWLVLIVATFATKAFSRYFA